jgi:hypothetical protein
MLNSHFKNTLFFWLSQPPLEFFTTFFIYLDKFCLAKDENVHTGETKKI